MNSRLVAGFGATRLTGPAKLTWSITKRIARHQVVPFDPAHELPALSHDPSKADPEWCEHPFERPAIAAENDADPQVDDPDTGLGGGSGCRLPGLADVGQEPLTRRRGLGQLLVPAVAVVADGRRRHEHVRLRIELGDRLRDEPCAIDAALANPVFHRSAPAARGDVFSREVHDSVNTGQGPGIDFALRWVPADLVAPLHVAPDEPSHRLARCV